VQIHDGIIAIVVVISIGGAPAKRAAIGQRDRHEDAAELATPAFASRCCIA
jgi:hypothetical protein